MVKGCIEYCLMRFLRRHTPQALTSFLSGRVSVLRPSLGVTDPSAVSEKFLEKLKALRVDIRGRTVLEVGCGTTNGTGYVLVGRGAGMWVGCDVCRLNPALDRKQFTRFGSSAAASNTRRISSVAEIGPESVDLVLSHSVLEHVGQPDFLFGQLYRVLKRGGIMVHCVDYRDHYFKYPFHFLVFSSTIWEHVLGPGDLYRFRPVDHVRAMENAGFSAAVFERQVDQSAFDAIKNHVHSDFESYSKEDLSTIYAGLYAEKS